MAAYITARLRRPERLEAELRAGTVVLRQTDYEPLEHKPSINGVTLSGDKSFEELGEGTITNSELAALVAQQYQIIFGGNGHAGYDI